MAEEINMVREKTVDQLHAELVTERERFMKSNMCIRMKMAADIKCGQVHYITPIDSMQAITILVSKGYYFDSVKCEWVKE